MEAIFGALRVSAHDIFRVCRLIPVIFQFSIFCCPRFFGFCESAAAGYQGKSKYSEIPKVYIYKTSNQNAEAGYLTYCACIFS